jgi:hypothetical protein
MNNCAVAGLLLPGRRFTGHDPMTISSIPAFPGETIEERFIHFGPDERLNLIGLTHEAVPARLASVRDIGRMVQLIDGRQATLVRVGGPRLGAIVRVTDSIYAH